MNGLELWDTTKPTSGAGPWLRIGDNLYSLEGIRHLWLAKRMTSNSSETFAYWCICADPKPNLFSDVLAHLGDDEQCAREDWRKLCHALKAKGIR